MDAHPSAQISSEAIIHPSVKIGPYVIIDGPVKIAEGVEVHSDCLISGRTEIGPFCRIFHGAIIGYPPQIRNQESARLGQVIIGKENIIREYATIHCASSPEAKTVIGDNNYFMGFSHIAHDCQIANRTTLCNGSLLAGHIQVEDDVFVSGNVTVHQFCRLGRLSMIGGLARISKDVPPYMLAKGDSEIWSTNVIGMRRANIGPQIRLEIKKAFKLIYRSRLSVAQALNLLEKDAFSEEAKQLIEFIRASKRGICGPAHVTGLISLLKSNFIKPRIAAYDKFLENEKIIQSRRENENN